MYMHTFKRLYVCVCNIESMSAKIKSVGILWSVRIIKYSGHALKALNEMALNYT